MSARDFIPKLPLTTPAQAYAALRSEGLLHLEALAHERWTDYNVHDPGIALLELLCFGLTDLGFRSAFEVRDLITVSVDGAAQVRAQFHTAATVLTGAATSFHELRKLLLDVAGVRNAWIEKHHSLAYCLDHDAQALVDCPGPAAARVETLPPLGGLFDVYLQLEEFVDQPGERTREDVRGEVVGRVLAHRNLCEDLVDICELTVEEIAVCADVEAAPGADLEALLAEIFYRIDQHVSPRIRFHSIDELRARGRAVEEIFSGPLLEHGFIDDDELRALQRRCEFRASDIVRMIMETDGVVAVRNLSLLSFIDGLLREQQTWRLQLAADRFRAPLFSAQRSKVVFYRSGLPYYANRDRVLQLLAEKKAADVSAKLRGHLTDLPLLPGVDRRPQDYSALQNELPANYMAGRLRVPDSEPALRKAQSKQLKAWLLLFEQLLANHLAQLAHAGELLSWDSTGPSYFSQPVTDIADLDLLLVAPAGSTVSAELQRILETPQERLARRNRLLEHLLGRFAESLNDYAELMRGVLKDAAADRLARDRRAFLADYPGASARRGQAYDYRRPADPSNLSGYQRRIYRLLGIDPPERRRFAGERLVIVPGSGERWRFVLLDADGTTRLFESVECETRSAIEALLDFVLGIAGAAASWRPAAGSTFELLRVCAEDATPEVIGATRSGVALEPVRAYFERYAAPEGCHVVEHLLLRKRYAGDPFLPVEINPPGVCDCPEVRDPYSFRMSVVLPSWPARFRDLRFRRFVEETLRREAPAHVLLRICWVSHDQMRAFEQAYDAWAAALAALLPQLGRCRTDATPAAQAAPTGELPLPPTTAATQAYADALRDLRDRLFGLINVFPLARLHDCEHTDGDTPQISLGSTTLGTF
jgi:hypothetical protein